MERCSLLADKGKMVERKELREWKTRHSRCQNKKEKGPVEPGKEEDKLESFFSHIYEFHNPVLVAPPPVFLPAELPARHVINFVPAAIPHASASTSVSVSASDVPVSAPALPASSDYSFASSVIPTIVPVNPPSCIGTTQ